MKIALCMSGGLRNFIDTHYSFDYYLLSQHDVDVYFYGLENKEGFTKNQEDFKKLYNPKEMVINTKEYYETIHCPFQQSSVFYSFYNIFMCNELKRKYEIQNNFKYNLVIRSRADYFWFRCLTNIELQLAQNNILIPADWAFKGVRPYARADVFAIGGSKLMDTYSLMFDKISDYINVIGMFHPESLCGYHLMINSIPNIENERCVVFEYPSKRTEKHISPYKHIKYFEEPNIENEDEFLKAVTDKRRTY